MRDRMDFRPVQFLKALMAIDVMLFGRTIAERLKQPSKEDPPMLSNPYERLIDVSPVQSSKEELPIVFTSPGIVSDVILLH